jgi:hypothetical protein
MLLFPCELPVANFASKQKKLQNKYRLKISFKNITMQSDTWGQLVSLTDIESEPIMLSNSTFTIGRGKGMIQNKTCF